MTYQGAIIGFGNVAAEAHLPAWLQSSDFTLRAVVDPRPERLQLARRLAPGVACYRTMAELFSAESLDCLDICTPPRVHDTPLLEAVARGLHILCEKPLTLSPAILRVLDSAARRGLAVFSVHNWQYAPQFHAMRETIRAGRIGSPQSLQWTTLRRQPAGPTPWRLDPSLAGGGVLVDHGWHVFYLGSYLLDAVPRAVAGRLDWRQGAPGGVEDTATGTVEYADARLHFHLSWASNSRTTYGTVRGTRGNLHFSPDCVWIGRRGGLGCRQRFFPALTASSYHPEWFPSVLRAFRRELEEPRGESLSSAALCLALVRTAYASHRQGGAMLPLLHGL